jgi:hypothetical protein
MAVTVQMQFEAVVTEIDEDAFGGSSIENGTTIIQCDRRKLDFQRLLGTPSTICGRQEPYAGERHELATFHNPITSRFSMAQGSYLHAQNPRVYCPPDIQGVSTSQQMSPSVIRLACYLAVVCGGSLRHLALLFAVRFLMPMTQSSMQRGIDDIGGHVPPPEERLRPLLARAPATECPIAGDYPLGTDACRRGLQDEPDRLLITHEAASEKGEDARQVLQRCKDLGLPGTAACADDSPSFTEAIKVVYPHARLQADHFPTVKTSWGHLKKSRLSYRRQIKASGAEPKAEPLLAFATPLGKLRWSLLKKPGNVSVEETQALAELEGEDAGLVQSCRPIIRQLVHIFDHTHREAQAKLRLHQLRQDRQVLADRHLDKMPRFFDAHWEQALRELRKKGMGTHRRGAHSASGMRLLRRLEKNHDGVRSAATRQPYIQIYQAMKYLSLDVADCIEQGPQLAELPSV